jgi:uncharacterized damage-inducible protein DinB
MRFRAPLALIALLLAAPAHAQIMGAFHKDLNEVQSKFLQLANAMPDASLDWRPGPGVRSVREVFLHVASDNYLIPIFMGKPAPAATGITSDYATATAYEKKALTKAQIVAELTASFAHVHQGLAVTTDNNLTENIKMFGQDFTRGGAAILLVTHLHEHLGQAIAYARSNKVVPPWSK